MDTRYLIGTIGQWCAFFTVLGGIIIELVLHAHLGWALITGGSLIFAGATKIKRRIDRG
jgi:hypothetical protein